MRYPKGDLHSTNKESQAVIQSRADAPCQAIDWRQTMTAMKTYGNKFSSASPEKPPPKKIKLSLEGNQTISSNNNAILNSIIPDEVDSPSTTATSATEIGSSVENSPNEILATRIPQPRRIVPQQFHQQNQPAIQLPVVARLPLVRYPPRPAVLPPQQTVTLRPTYSTVINDSRPTAFQQPFNQQRAQYLSAAQMQYYMQSPAGNNYFSGPPPYVSSNQNFARQPMPMSMPFSPHMWNPGLISRTRGPQIMPPGNQLHNLSDEQLTQRRLQLERQQRNDHSSEMQPDIQSQFRTVQNQMAAENEMDTGDLPDMRYLRQGRDPNQDEGNGTTGYYSQ